MDLTKYAGDIASLASKKIAEVVSKDIAHMVSDALKEQILEAQKYRIDKEFEFKTREQNLTKANFCPNCNKFTNNKIQIYKIGIRLDIYHCQTCNLDIPLK